MGYGTSFYHNDSYFPEAESVISYTKDPAVLAHEFGHARDPYINDPGKYVLERERYATDLASQHVKNITRLKHGLKSYEEAYKTPVT